MESPHGIACCHARPSIAGTLDRKRRPRRCAAPSQSRPFARAPAAFADGIEFPLLPCRRRLFASSRTLCEGRRQGLAKTLRACPIICPLRRGKRAQSIRPTRPDFVARQWDLLPRHIVQNGRIRFGLEQAKITRAGGATRCRGPVMSPPAWLRGMRSGTGKKSYGHAGFSKPAQATP
jgi:hypothetical protein